MSTTPSSTRQHRSVAATGSLFFHVAFVVILILAMRSCGSGGDGMQFMALSIASLGDYEQGEGDPTPTPASASQPKPQEAAPREEDPIETVDESPVVAPKVTEKPKPKPVEKPAEKPVDKPAEKPQQPSDALNNALNQLGKPGSPSGSSGGGGNEGRPDGQIEGKGVFSGGGGSGEWSLAGRSIRTKPSLDERPTEEGTIRVDITVDRNGNVIAAKADPVNSKTTGQSFAVLAPLAEKAARSAKFSAAEAASNSRGTITIHFTLR